MHHALVEYVTPTLQLLDHMSLEELVLVLASLLPLSTGWVAAFQAFTYRSRPSSGRAGGEGLERMERAFATQEHAALATLRATEQHLDERVAELRRTDEARCNDLHRDLLGIVYEVSKLRVDMARLAQAQLGVSYSRAAVPSPSRLPTTYHQGQGISTLPAPAVLPSTSRSLAQSQRAAMEGADATVPLG